MKKIKKSINPVKPVQSFILPTLPFHELFPFYLKYKDHDESKDCFFKDEIDLKKHLERYKIKNYTVTKTQPRK